MSHVEIMHIVSCQNESTIGDDIIKEHFCSSVLFLVHVSLGLHCFCGIFVCTTFFIIVFCRAQVFDCILQVSFYPVPSRIGVRDILQVRFLPVLSEF